MSRVDRQLNHRYRPLRHEDAAADGRDAADVSTEADRLPVKALVLAGFLFCTGVVFFTCWALFMTGRIHPKPGAGWGFLTLGFITSVPGTYALAVAYLAWRGVPGYSYKDLPAYQ